MKDVPSLDRHLEPELKARIDRKAKPLGALGRVEELAVQLGLITQSLAPAPGKAAVVVFAGDHGIVEEGVAAYPPEVSAAIAQMVLDDVAGANIAAQAVSADVFVVDAGLKTRLTPHPRLIDRAIGEGTRNFAREPAMTSAQVTEALEAGAEIAAELSDRGYRILALGEIGIGNSSSAALVAHAVSGLPLDSLVGQGAGAPAGGMSHKLRVLKAAYERAVPFDGGAGILAEFGGFELAMLAGAMIGAANSRLITIVDGFIATAAACAAISLQPNLRHYLIFAHLSPESGHGYILEWLRGKPLLDLGMRLGEGTGAALAIPVVRMAGGLLRDMADLPGAHPEKDG